MRKRVGLARALVMSPEVMLYDEPTTGLDPIMGDIINELILRTRRLHPVTSVVVTHDMLTAHKVADRVVMIYPLGRLRDDEPQVIYDGPPEGLEDCDDRRVVQFVRGEAGERLMELREEIDGRVYRNGRIMDERVIRIRVGVVVLAAALVTATLVVHFGEFPNVFRGQYTVYLAFPEAPGVTLDTPVRKNGILIGRVSEVELLDEGGVMISVQIENKFRLRRNEIARIRTASLLGDAIIEFVPSGEKGAPTDLIADGDVLENGVVVGDPLKALEIFVSLEGDLRSSMDSFRTAGDEVAQTARNINAVVGNNEHQIQRIVQKSELALDEFHGAMQGIDEIMGDPEMRQRLRKSLEDLPALIADARQTLQNARDTLENFERVGQRAETNLENLEGFTKPLGERGPQLVENIERSMRNLDELLAQMVRFSEALNNREGTLGKLVYEPEVYNKLDRAAANVEDVSRRLRPIIDDLRVFSDKIATDPRQLGVKGAMDRRPTGMKYMPQSSWDGAPAIQGSPILGGDGHR
jgi:phospholipid/cholesterol/gamma-HCH transport system substrate-binding protein